jgi:hypothetical protein
VDRLEVLGRDGGGVGVARLGARGPPLLQDQRFRAQVHQQVGEADALALEGLVEERVVEVGVRRRHLAGVDHPLHEDLGAVEEGTVLEDQHALLLLAGHQVADLALLQHPHVQERRLGREDVGDAVVVEEGEALVGEGALLDALREGVGLAGVEQGLEFRAVRVGGEGVHERRLPGEEVAHDADVEVAGRHCLCSRRPGRVV